MTRIRQLRAQVGLRGLTQYDLASRLCMSRDRLIRIERGYTVPTRAEAKAIAKALGCAVVALGIPSFSGSKVQISA